MMSPARMVTHWASQAQEEMQEGPDVRPSWVSLLYLVGT